MRTVLTGTVVALAVVACTSAGPIESPTTTPPTEAPSTSTVPNTTVPNTTQSTPTTPPSEPVVPPTDASNCNPGTEGLGDGMWFGFVVDATSTTIEFDLACWFGGQAAVEAAAEDGQESPPPNDYYIRNENPATRRLEVASDAAVMWYPTGDPTGGAESDFPGWVAGRQEAASEIAYPFGVWITIESGAVVSIAEQWVP